MPSHLVATLAGAALVVGGFAAGTGTRSASALPTVATIAAAAAPAATGGQCQVEVRRSGDAGSSDIRRRQIDNTGDCVCIITTGPSSTNGAAEDIVRALLRDRECTNALAPADLGTTGAAGTAGAGGGIGGVVLPVVFGVGAIGLGAALGGSSKG